MILLFPQPHPPGWRAIFGTPQSAGNSNVIPMRKRTRKTIHPRNFTPDNGPRAA